MKSAYKPALGQLRNVSRLFSLLTLTALAISLVAVSSLWSTVRSKHALARTYESVVRQTDDVQFLSERRARKLRTGVLLSRRSDELDALTARREFDVALESLAVTAGSGALAPLIQATRIAGEELATLEDQLLSLVRTATPTELSHTFQEQVLPSREDLDAAILELRYGADALLDRARDDSSRADAQAIGALSVTLAISLIAIALLLTRVRSVLIRLRAKSNQLERMTTFQQYLMGMVGHDIRTPLNTIQLAASALPRTRTATDNLDKLRARIERSATRIERIAGVLVDVARIQAGLEIPIAPRPVDLHDVVEALLDELRTAKQREIEHKSIGDGACETDDERVAEVVTNLVNNAVEYSPPGSLVAVTTMGTDDQLEIDVHNDGAIAPDMLPRVFDAFTSGHGQRTTKGHAGLGLYIARSLTEALHGRIDVHSSQPKGTTFRVVIPRDWSSRATAMPARS